MLCGNQIRMVVAASKPIKTILSIVEFNIARANISIKWDIKLSYEDIENQVQFNKISKLDKLMWKSDVKRMKWIILEGGYDIVAINVGKNMWYLDYGTVQDYGDARQILENNNEVIIYANLSTDTKHCKNILGSYNSAW